MWLVDELQAFRKAVNLSINKDLLVQAKDAGINRRPPSSKHWLRLGSDNGGSSGWPTTAMPSPLNNEHVELHGSSSDGVGGF